MKYLTCYLVATWILLSSGNAQEFDSVILYKIKQEGLQNSQVMDHAFFLTDVYGSRLTGSPSFKKAGDWLFNRLQSFYPDKIQKQKIDWGRSWSYNKFSVFLMQPYVAALIASPGPWCSGTNGFVQGEPFLAPAPTDVLEESYKKYTQSYKGNLKGRFVLVSPPHAIQPQPAVTYRRFSDEELLKLSHATVSASGTTGLSDSIFQEFRNWGIKLNRFFLDEGVLGLIFQSRGDGGMVVAHGPSWAREISDKLPPTIFLATEQYNQVIRLMQKKIPVRLGVEMNTRYHNDTSASFNIIADIQGKGRKDELVTIGAHLDSWTAGVGATDDAAGCAILVEVMRILKILRVQPQRTIRFVFWGGHEGAGLGSKSYIQKHFGDSSSKNTSREKLFVYFNLDNGGGKIRGLYLPQRDSSLHSFFQNCLDPLKHLGASTIVPVGTPSGSDHANFYKAGLPGIMFIQDPLDYRSRTWHSNLDLYDRLQPEDLKQAAIVVASLIYAASVN